MDDYANGSLSRQTVYTYDPIMQQLASTASPEGTIHYVYNAIGQQIETYTDNTDTAYGFDVQGRLVSVTVTKLNGQSVVPLVTSYSYDLAGGTRPGGGTAQRARDDRQGPQCQWS